MRVAVLASGQGTNLAALLQAIDAGQVDARVGLVVSDRADAGCLHRARQAGVAALELPPQGGREAYDQELADALRAEAPDLVVLAGFMRILGPRVLAAFPDRIVNLHPSLLPAFPGARAVRDALCAGVRITGCTTHLVTAELDAGPILLQAAVPVLPDDDEARLAARVHEVEHQVLPRTVQLFAEDRVRVERGRAVIAPGPSWNAARLPGALYPEGFW